MQKGLLAGLLLLISLPTNAEINNLTNTEFKQLLDKGVPVIDIRRPEEWQQTGIIDGSHLLTFFDKKGNYNVEKWMAEFNKIAGPETPFILICRTGSRTGKISRYLDGKLKYNRVAHVAKGIKFWISEGETTVKPELQQRSAI